MTLSIAVSSLLFLGCMVLILTEVVHRTTAAFIGAVLMVLAGMLLGFYTQEEAVASIDFNTVGLLMGMMILVALLQPTGFFQYLAVWMGRLSKGRSVRLLLLLGLLTSVVSMFLDNVTTVVLIAPITLLICEILGLNSQPYLISEAILSNTGGISTLVGDPPNVLIASAAGFAFVDFLTHSFPIIILVWTVAFFVLRWLFRANLPECAPNATAVLDLQPSEALEDKASAIKIIVVIAGVVLLFFMEEWLHMRPAFVALAASAVALLWVKPSVQETLQKVQWDVLIFFAGLFVMIGGIEASGALTSVANLISQMTALPNVVLGLSILWIVALLSAVVDNIPITIALIPIIQSLGAAGMAVNPLWWALVFGAGLGGNGTIVGSTANVVVVSLSEKTRHRISSNLWNKRGLPVMLATCTTASILYAVFFSLFK
jgi:Na+/H+ antiporter NhaD/arsenite permease-like protein